MSNVIRNVRASRIENALYAQDATTRDLLTNEAVRVARKDQDARIDTTSADISSEDWQVALARIERHYARRFWASLYLQLREVEGA